MLQPILSNLFKLRLGASIGRFVRRSVGWLVVPSKKIWTTSVAPMKLLFDMQLPFTLTKIDIEKKIENILRSSSKSQF